MITSKMLALEGVEDLQHDTVQWYIDGMDRENMKEVVQRMFTAWLKENPI